MRNGHGSCWILWVLEIRSLPCNELCVAHDVTLPLPFDSRQRLRLTSVSLSSRGRRYWKWMSGSWAGMKHHLRQNIFTGCFWSFSESDLSAFVGAAAQLLWSQVIQRSEGGCIDQSTPARVSFCNTTAFLLFEMRRSHLGERLAAQKNWKK